MFPIHDYSLSAWKLLLCRGHVADNESILPFWANNNSFISSVWITNFNCVCFRLKLVEPEWKSSFKWNHTQTPNTNQHQNFQRCAGSSPGRSNQRASTTTTSRANNHDKAQSRPFLYHCEHIFKWQTIEFQKSATYGTGQWRVVGWDARCRGWIILLDLPFHPPPSLWQLDGLTALNFTPRPSLPLGGSVQIILPQNKGFHRVSLSNAPLFLFLVH